MTTRRCSGGVLNKLLLSFCVLAALGGGALGFLYTKRRDQAADFLQTLSGRIIPRLVGWYAGSEKTRQAHRQELERLSAALVEKARKGISGRALDDLDALRVAVELVGRDRVVSSKELRAVAEQMRVILAREDRAE